MKKSTRNLLLLGGLIAIAWAIFGMSQFSGLGMTASHQAASGILVLAAILWITELVPLFVTSLLVLFLCLAWLSPTIRFEGGQIEDSEFLSQFFSDIIVLFFGGFVLAAAFRRLGIDTWFACWILSKTGNSIPSVMLGIMAITALLSMWLSNTSAAALMLAITIPICDRLPADDRYRKALVLSVPFAANIGGLGTPIGSPPNAIAIQYMKSLGSDPSFGIWMLIGVPGVITMLFLTWAVLLWMYRGLARTIEYDDAGQPLALTGATITVIVTSAITVLGWLTGQLHGLSNGTVAMLPVLIFFGARILDTQDLRSLSWEVLLLMGGGLCLGTALSASGLAEWLIAKMAIEGWSTYALMVAFGVVACLMSSVMSNTATSNLIMPMILGLSTEPLSPLLIATAFSCSLAMPLPVSTPPNAMAFSSGQLTTGDLLKPGTLLTISGIILVFTLGYWWWKMVGII